MPSSGCAGLAAHPSAPPTDHARIAASRMKVWVDMTASAHVLVFRPLIRLLRERGDEVEITAREGAVPLLATQRPAPLGATARLRPGARARLARADPDRATARHPERDDARLRVRVAPAPPRDA